MILLAPAASAGISPSGAAVASLPSISGSAAAPQPRNLTFYMHNSTLAKDVNGVTTPYIFDTLQNFGPNNTVTNVGRVKQDWYLFPPLAGPLSVNGTISLHLFLSVQGVTLSATPTLTVSEVDGAGATVWTTSVTSGSQSWWTTPHDLVVNITSLQHTFGAGSTILVVAEIVVGASSSGTIWYNSSWVPTHLVLQSDDFARINDLSFLDSTGTPRVNFDPLAPNKTITIVANVTDPLGGYDIHWVNLTLVQPGGTTVLDAAPMTHVSGTPISYASLYELAWNYSGHPVGRYNATASVVDNSGYYHFQQFYTTAGFLDSMDASFYVGGLPTYVNVKAVDSKSVALAGARIALTSGNVAVDAKVTDSGGLANFTMAIGPYTFQVWWQGIQVASQDANVSANVSAANPLVIVSSVYYPVFQAEDADGKALAGASILFLHPNGTKLGPFKTNATGDVALSQVPLGTYGLVVSWRGVDVFTGTESVSSNGVIAFRVAVYELTVTAKSGSGGVIPGVFVSVVDSTGLVFDASVTGSDGTVVLRLPAGDYTVDARYITDQMGTLYDSGVRSQDVSLTSSSGVTITFADFPIPFTSTFAFLVGLLYAVTVAALLIAFFLLWRRRGRGEKKPVGPEKKE